MKPLRIGDHVKVTAIAELQYEQYKRAAARIAVDPFFAVVVGKAVKRVGRYSPARGGGYSGEDYDPAYLAIEGSVTLWEVRTGMTNKSILVHDDDLEPTGDKVTIPNRGIKPKRIEQAPV